MSCCKEEPRTMGLGKLASSNLVFVREFRWTVNSEGLDEYCARAIKVNHKKQTITLDLYEIVNPETNDISTHQWIESVDSKPMEKSLVLKTLDGCGHVLYKQEFYELILVSNNITFDYDKGGISVRRVKMRYACSKTEYPLKDFHYEMLIADNVFEIRLNQRPKVTVEELDHQGNIVPVSVEWTPLQFSLANPNLESKLVECLSKASNVTVYLLQGKNKLETWQLSGPLVSKIKADGFELSYKRVHYQQGKSL